MWPFKKKNKWGLKGSVEFCPVPAVLPPRFVCDHKQRTAYISEDARIVRCRDCKEELAEPPLARPETISAGWKEYDPWSNQYLIRDIVVTQAQVQDSRCWNCKRTTNHPDCWCGSRGCTTPSRLSEP